MPLGSVRFKPFGKDVKGLKHTYNRVWEMTRELRACIAENLVCDERPTPTAARNVKIHLDDGQPGDWGTADISIAIEAVKYPGRLANVNERAKQIQDWVIEYFGDDPPTVSVWLKLFDAGWAGPD